MTDRRTTAERPIVAVSRRAMPGDPAARISGLADVREWPAIAHPDRPSCSRWPAARPASCASTATGSTRPCWTPARTCGWSRSRAPATTRSTSPAADRRGVAVTNSRGTLFETTADLTFGLILAARRRICEAERYLRTGSWVQDDLDLLLGHDVHGATLGIVGYGEIGAGGRAPCGRVRHDRRAPQPDAGRRRAVATGCPRRAAPRQRHRVAPRPDVAGDPPPHRRARAPADEADRDPGQRGARRRCVDEAALVRALREGWIGSAGLDVQQVEPNPDPDDPLLAPAELRRAAPHRFGDARRARGDDRDGDRQRGRVPRGPAALTPVGTVGRDVAEGSLA